MEQTSMEAARHFACPASEQEEDASLEADGAMGQRGGRVRLMTNHCFRREGLTWGGRGRCGGPERAVT